MSTTKCKIIINKVITKNICNGTKDTYKRNNSIK